MDKCLVRHKQRVLAVLLLFIFSPIAFNLRFVSGSSQNQSSISIQSAEEAVSSAFEAILEAEGAGGNVSLLLSRLGEAADLLSQAKIMLDGSSDQDAVEFVTRSTDIADEVKNEALVLKNSVLSQREFAFKITLVSSVVGVAMFLIIMFLFWRWFRVYYSRKIISLRPEVV